MKNFKSLLVLLAIAITAFSCEKKVNEGTPELNVDKTNISFTAQGGSENIVITSNRDWTIAPIEGDWATFERTGSGNQTAAIVVEANPTSEPRTMKLQVSYTNIHHTITLTQAGSNPALIVTPNKIEFYRTAHDLFLRIRSNSDLGWTIDVPNDLDWVVFEKIEGTGDTDVKVTSVINQISATRSSEITVSCGDIFHKIAVVQNSALPELTLDKAQLLFEETAGSKTFAITCNGAWTITGAAAWVTLSKSSGSGNDVITVSTPAYTGTEERSSMLTIDSEGKKQPMNVRQFPAFLDILTKIPDPVMKKMCLKYDTNDDLRVSEVEAAAVKSLILRGEYQKQISSIEGIQYFVNAEFVDLSINLLAKVNLSVLPKLERFTLNNNLNLTEIKLDGIEGQIKVYYAGSTSLTKFDPSLFTNIDSVYLIHDGVGSINESSIDFSNSPSLKYFACRSQYLSNIDVTKCPELKDLWIDSKALKVLDLSKNLNINWIYISALDNKIPCVETIYVYPGFDIEKMRDGRTVPSYVDYKHIYVEKP